ncbi:MAG: hypothetical protein FD166_3151 [Bacteroidetes bacterium]|nr:MAG: hypothetical protein FD166_3151 [Bacteroidota bacterium]
MKKFSILLLSLLFVQLIYSQNISFEWLKLLGQSGRNEIKCIISDTNNNIIVGGYFENSLEINGHFINSKGSKDYLIAKYDASGNNLWYLYGGGKLDDYISDITFVNNRLFVLGVFSDSITFENGEFKADSLTDLFIGEMIEDKIYGIDKFSGKGVVNSEKLFAKGDNLFITGSFEGEIIIVNDTLISTGYWDYIWPGTDSIYRYVEHMLLVKYNLQNKINWYKNYKNARSLSITTDNSNNLYLIASHYGNCLIEDEIEISENLFLIKYDENGDYIWHITGGPSGQITQPYDLVCLENQLYITGHIAGDNLYIGSYDNIVEKSWYDAFLCKMDTSGNIVWFNQIGEGSWRDNIGPHHNYGNVIKIISDTIYIAGHFLEEINFGTIILNSQGAYDLFYAKYLKNGAFFEAGQYLVEGWSSANDIAIDTSGNIYIAGYSFENNTSSNETQFLLFGKIDSLTNNPNSIDSYTSKTINVFPNPTRSSFTIDFHKELDRKIQVIDMQGKIVLSTKSNMSKIDIDDKGLKAGLYLITISEKNGFTKLKLIKTG